MKRTKWLQVRLTDSEDNTLKSLSDKLGISKSEMARQLLLGKVVAFEKQIEMYKERTGKL